MKSLFQSSIARILLGILGAVLMAGSLVGCASNAQYPMAPAATDASDHKYKIGPLDTLNVVVWRNADLTATVTVRPDGRISTPLVEDVQAAGRTAADLAREIEAALSKFIRDPVVTVMVSGFQGTYAEQIRIVGEASRPQSVPYRQNMTVLDVMIQAGGLTDFADGNAAVLVRSSENAKQYRIRLRDLLKRGDISANIAVRPGDIIIVPQSWF